MPAVDEEVKLEHDMARFIATNMAATGLLPSSVAAVRGWLQPENKPKETAPSKVVEVRTESILDHGMPIPPPPPDISELMTADETGSQTKMVNNIHLQQQVFLFNTDNLPNILNGFPLLKQSPDDQNISLSSLLESAMSGLYQLFPPLHNFCLFHTRTKLELIWLSICLSNFPFY